MHHLFMQVGHPSSLGVPDPAWLSTHPARADGHLNLKPLFERVYPGLVRYLYRRLGDRDLAEDIAQEAFVRLLRVSPDNPDGWLFVVAANLARDAVRTDVRRARRLTLLSNSPDTAVVPTPELALLSIETAAQVQAGLATLSERDRSLLLMHEEGVSYRALAEILQVKPSSIAPLLGRARARLLRALTNQSKATHRAPASA